MVRGSKSLTGQSTFYIQKKVGLSGLIIGGADLVLFIISCLLKRQPLLVLRVFKSADFTRGIVAS